jgi:hypothetical protein
VVAVVSKPILAWHFVARDRKLGHGDGRIVRKGQTLRVDPPITLCVHGLHASVQPLDALGYAAPEQLIACRVRVGGEIVTDDDKIAGSERTCLWWVDAEKTLHEFACWCAEGALKRAGVTDVWCWAAIDTKRKWLRGEATDAELAAAWAAAWDAARAAARAAAGAAAWAAAGAAARAAAGAAAGDAAWDAARAAQNRKLAAMLTSAAAKKAVRS